jgi:hypothetical protein
MGVELGRVENLELDFLNDVGRLVPRFCREDRRHASRPSERGAFL